MTAERPRDVPAVREHLVRSCAAVYASGGEQGRFLTAWELETLTSDDLRMVWVSADMLSVVLDAAPTVPDDLSLPELPRFPSGLAMFARPIEALDAWDETRRVTVEGVLWGPTRVRRGAGKATTGTAIAAVGRFGDPDPVWVPVGRSEWMDDEPLSVVNSDRLTPVAPMPARGGRLPLPTEDTWGAYKASAVEDRVLLAALAGLMNEPRVAQVGTWAPHNKSTRRRYGNVSVSTVTLRSERAAARSGATQGGRLTHRSYVAPYFRMQPYGPGGGLRRLQMVSGHIRGPEGAPMLKRNTVWSLVR